MIPCIVPCAWGLNESTNICHAWKLRWAIVHLVCGMFAYYIHPPKADFPELSAWGDWEFDEVELQRVTSIHFCIWSSIVSKLHSWNGMMEWLSRTSSFPRITCWTPKSLLTWSCCLVVGIHWDICIFLAFIRIIFCVNYVFQAAVNYQPG